MFRSIVLVGFSFSLFMVGSNASGRGFGGFRGGGSFGGSFGGADRFGGFSGSADRSFGGGESRSFSSFSGADRYGGSYSGSRSGSSYSGWDSRGASSSYDRSWTDARGGSVNTSGTRSAEEGRYGGVGVSGNRDTSVTTAGGRTYNADRQGAAISGPGGRTIGGASGTVDGRYGSDSWQSAFSGNRYTGNMDHYASVYGANGAHSTAYWSSGYMGTRGTAVRTNFGYYGAFHPAWYTAHPGSWYAAGWAAGTAWAPVGYAALAGFCALPAEAANYDYGSNIVYNNDQVYVDGQAAATPTEIAQQATTLADMGQTAKADPQQEWKALGVFALVQGDEKTSNNIFQIAINKDDVLRGNYYDGLMDTNTPIYGAVDKTTQRAAWTIGKKNDRVFEAGIYNLTQSEAPILVHIGTTKTVQMMLVRVEQPKTGSK